MLVLSQSTTPLWNTRENNNKAPTQNKHQKASTRTPHIVKSVLRWSVTSPHRPSLDLSGMPSEKTDFPRANGYQLQRASWLEMGLCVHFSIPKLEFCVTRICAGPEILF